MAASNEPARVQFQSMGFIEAGGDEDDEFSSDVDAGYETGSDGASSYQSEIFDFRYEHGRRYHGYRDGRYLMPNDAVEQNRLDITHNVYLMMLDGALHVVPFTESPTRILDIGTGTGIWAIDMALQYESAEVIGTDLSPIQPEWVPPNCRFDIDDAESEWLYPRNSFDFIHSRHVGSSINDYPQFIRRIYDHLQPGGWVQLVEHEHQFRCDDGTYPKESATYRFWDYFGKALRQIGKDPEVPAKIEDLLKAHGGFTDVRRISLKAAWGTWPKDKKLKEMAKWINVILQTGATEAYGMALFTRYLGMSVEEVKKLFANVEEEIRLHKMHIYQYQHFFIARKPLDAKETYGEQHC